jgi:hypothetical protein
MKNPLVLALVHQRGFAATEVDAAIPTAGEQPAFTYQNPISKGIDPKGLRDCQVFTGPDANPWLSCHGVLNSARHSPMLVIDPIRFGHGGMALRRAPTHLPQIILRP